MPSRDAIESKAREMANALGDWERLESRQRVIELSRKDVIHALIEMGMWAQRRVLIDLSQGRAVDDWLKKTGDGDFDQ